MDCHRLHPSEPGLAWGWWQRRASGQESQAWLNRGCSHGQPQQGSYLGVGGNVTYSWEDITSRWEQLRRHNRQMPELVLIRMSKCRSGLVGETNKGVNVRRVVSISDAAWGRKVFFYPRWGDFRNHGSSENCIVIWRKFFPGSLKKHLPW